MKQMIEWCRKNIFWLTATACGVGATPALVKYAYSVRGYKAIGGEVLVPFIVPLLWCLAGTIDEFFEEEREDDNEVSEE